MLQVQIRVIFKAFPYILLNGPKRNAIIVTYVDHKQRMGRLWKMYMFFPYLSYLPQSGTVELTVTCMRDSRGSTPGGKTIYIFSRLLFWFHVYLNVVSFLSVPTPRNTEICCSFPAMSYQMLIHITAICRQSNKNKNRPIQQKMYFNVYTPEKYERVCVRRKLLIFKSRARFQVTRVTVRFLYKIRSIDRTL